MATRASGSGPRPVAIPLPARQIRPRLRRRRSRSSLSFMCGIVALFLNRPLNADDIALGRRLTADLRHRGPDGAGEWRDEAQGVFFGHRRLKIVDLSEAAAQPMHRGGHVVTYNGELYNFRELRESMEAEGIGFETRSDTEVLLQAWRHWGSGALDRFDAMFALALWDGEAGWIAGDPFGEKPLYYAEGPDGVIACSELAPLVRALRPRAGMTGETLQAFLALGYVPAPDTAWEGIRRLLPGEMLRIEAGRCVARRRYWRAPDFEAAPGPIRPLGEGDLDRIRDVLIESLERRLIADVPRCLFLSNGVDSTLTAALLVNELQQDVDCLTVRFDDSDVADEADGAVAVAGRLGLSHRVVQGRPSLGDDPLVALLEIFGQPSDNAAVQSVATLARAAREAGFTVGLSGTGGDESFFGYKKQQFFWQWRYLMGLPEGLRRSLSGLAALSPVFRSQARVLARYVGVGDGARYVNFKNQVASDGLRALLPGHEDWVRRALDPGDQPAEIFVPQFERDSVLPGSQLPAVDLGAMAHGFELRSPFLSRRLADTVAGMDARAFLAYGQKSVSKRLLARYLPLDMLRPIKSGLRFPVRAAIRDRSPSALAPELRALDRWAREHLDESMVDQLGLRLGLLGALSAWPADEAAGARLAV